MFHIGFDPLLEARQQHEALIRQNELIRLAQESKTKTRSRIFNFYRLMARLGKGMAVLGINLESRFGNSLDDRISMNTTSSTGNCSS